MCPRQVARMCRPLIVLLTVLLASSIQPSEGAERVGGRDSLVFTNASARLVVDLAGGAIGDFRPAGSDVNPLHWGTPPPGDRSVRGFGHFLCLDRWGPPSEAEGAKGMPYHGEAANVAWSVVRGVGVQNGRIEAEMTAALPKAGLSVRRRIRMSTTEAVFAVEEEVTNDNALGRIYNAVQHPTVGPPFLDEQTVVDCNGTRGFAQGGSLPHPEEPTSHWPRAITRDGESVDLRRLTSDPDPNVVTYAIEGEYGWVTATSPTHGLVLGYLWKTSDYPWVSLWRDVRDGKPSARGLEFGTTGLHQPFPILVKKGRMWERPLFEYLDAGETVSRSYTAFLLKIPAGFSGVDSVKLESGRIVVKERSRGKAREVTLPVESLLKR